jgi:hypothetical protein
MTGMPNGLRVHWAKDTELVAEDAGSMLQPPLCRLGDHGPKGQEVEATAPLRSQDEVEDADSSSSHNCGICQVLDARLFQDSVARTNKDLVVETFWGQETNQQTRPFAKLWTKFSTFQAPMDSSSSKMVQAAAAFDKN